MIVGQHDSIDAIQRYMLAQVPRNVASKAAAAEWFEWFADLGNFDKTFSTAAYDHARNLRNRYWRADAVGDPAKEAQVEQVIQQGATAEENQGETRRLPASGYYPESRTITEQIQLALVLGGIGWLGWQMFKSRSRVSR